MRKRYLALFLAIATVMAQIIGTGQSAWAAEVVTEEALPQEGLPGEEEGDTDEDGLVIQTGEEGDTDEDGLVIQTGEEGDTDEDGLVIQTEEEKNGIRGDEEDYTWLYEGETQTFYLESTGVITWKVGEYGEEGDEQDFSPGDENNPVTWTEDGNRITVTGVAEQEQLYICAIVGEEGQQVRLRLDIRKETVREEYKLGEVVTGLSGTSYGIQEDIGGTYVENQDYPLGETVNRWVISKIESSNPDIASTSEDSDAENIWWIDFNNPGNTEIAIEYYIESNPGETFTKRVPVRVYDEERDYRIHIGYETKTILYEKPVDFTVDIKEIIWGNEEKEIPVDLKDIEFKWEVLPASGDDWGEEVRDRISLSQTGTNSEKCQVTVPKIKGVNEIRLKASAYRGSAELASDEISLQIADSYYKLQYDPINAKIWPGETAQLNNLNVYYYDSQGAKRIPDSRIKYGFDYSEEDFEITDKDGKKIDNSLNEFIECSDSINIKRWSAGNCWLTVWAEIRNEQGEAVTYISDELGFDDHYDDYDKAEIDVGIDLYNNTIFASADSKENDIIVARLDTSKIKGEYEVEWRVVDNRYEEEGEQSPLITEGVTVSRDKKEITLDAWKIKEAIKKAGIEMDENDVYDFLEVQAILKIGSHEINTISRCFKIDRPHYEMNEDMHRDITRGTTFTYSTEMKDTKCIMWGKNYREGKEVMASVKNIIIDADDEQDAVWKTERSGNFILLTALKKGIGGLTFTINGSEFGSTDENMHIYVVDKQYKFSVGGLGDGIFAPGDVIKTSISVTHEYYDEKQNKAVARILDPASCKITYRSYDRRTLTVDEDGTINVLKGAKEYIMEPIIKVNLTVTHEDGTIDRDSSSFYVQICPAHKFIEKERKNGDCTHDGYVVLKCDLCGKQEQKTVPKTGHSFGAWTVTTQPTVLAEGTQTRTCKVCNTKETGKISKLKAVASPNVKTLPLKVKQSTTAIKITMAKGDSIVSWKSSAPKVASVNSKGKITGKKAGTAKITATLKSGAKVTVKVKVQKKAVATSKLTVTAKTAKIKGKKLTLKKGKKDTLVAAVTPLTSMQKVKYKTTDKSIVTVDSKGRMKAKKAGKAKITVQSGKKKVVITVTVKK
ncbi:MAG: hypothetical protein HFG97_16010 [Dorea sp.]|nr:hypothetical protein [Dorea sp.]